MKTYKGMIVPDFITKATDVDNGDGRVERVLELVKDFDHTSRSFLRFCMSERDLNSPAFREFCEATYLVMNIQKDEKHDNEWKLESFTPQQYTDLVRRLENPAYRKSRYLVLHADEIARLEAQLPAGDPVVKQALAVHLKQRDNTAVWKAQYGKAKWPTDGKLFFAKNDVMRHLYAKYLKINPDALSPRERVARSPILFGSPRTFSVPPRLMMLPGESGGVAYVSRAYAAQQGIHEGDKLWPTKSSAMLMDMASPDVDIILPADTIKFEEHKAKPGVLATLMATLPDLAAEVRSSVPKKRSPRLGFDTLQWLDGVTRLYAESPAVQSRLAFVRKVVEGQATTEEILSLAAYTNDAGEVKYAQEFQFLQNGQPKETARVRKAIFNVAATAALKVLNLRARGRYGVAMPLREGEEAAVHTMICPPWMLPMKAKASYATDNVVAADSDWLIGCLGKDYDGDLLISLHLDALIKRINPKLSFPDWTNEADRTWAREYMALPEKKKANDPRDVHAVMLDGLKSYGLIGVATNACMVVLDALRAQGTDRKTLMGTYLRMMSTDVQPFVDGLKYTPGGLTRPRVETGKQGPGLAVKYGADEELAKRLTPYFRAIRKMDFETLAVLPEDDTLAGSFYYQLARLFTGWQPYKAVDLRALALKVLAEHPLPPTLDTLRKRSYVQCGASPEARLALFQHAVTTDEQKLALIAKCWECRDTRLALHLEKTWNLRLLQTVVA